MLYYFRMSIIIGILYAAGWMQLSRAELTEEDLKIHYCETALGYAKSYEMKPPNGINHFESWDSWKRTSKEFKMVCVDEFEKEMMEASVSYTSKDKKKLGELAYKALDTIITREVEDIMQFKPLTERIEQIFKAGHYMRFSAHMADNYQGRNFQRKFDEMKQSASDMSEDEATARMAAEFLCYKFL